MSTSCERGIAAAWLTLALSAGFAPVDAAAAQDVPARPVRAPDAAPAGGAVTVESQDEVLKAALARLARARTPAHLAEVGDRYYDLGIRDKAMEYYARALRQDRAFVAALDGAARVFRDWRQFGEALGSAHRATYFGAHRPEPWNTLGTILQALDRPVEAGQAYRRAIAVDRSAVYARSNLCYLALTGGDSEGALDQCRQALAIDEHFTPARNNLALLFAASGERERANETFKLASGDAAGHYNTGLVLMAQQDYAAAVLAFEAAYHADPKFEAAHRLARVARQASRRGMETSDGHRSR